MATRRLAACRSIPSAILDDHHGDVWRKAERNAGVLLVHGPYERSRFVFEWLFTLHCIRTKFNRGDATGFMSPSMRKAKDVHCSRVTEHQQRIV